MSIVSLENKKNCRPCCSFSQKSLYILFEKNGPFQLPQRVWNFIGSSKRCLRCENI